MGDYFMSELINGDAGRIGFLLKGDYSADSTYDFLDVVYYNGSSYVAKKETTGNVPTENNEYWHIFAMGATGDFASGEIYGDAAISLGRVQDSFAGENSIAYGKGLKATGTRAVSFGSYNEASGENSIVAGYDTFSIGRSAFSFGEHLYSVANDSFSEGCANISAGFGSHSEGLQNISGTNYVLKIASYDVAFKKFVFDDTYIGFLNAFSSLEVGSKLFVQNIYYLNGALTFTVSSIDSNEKSVVVSENIPASSFATSFATVIRSNNNAMCAHAEGCRTVASGDCAHAGGRGTIANGIAQTAIGRFNIGDTNGGFANPLIVGIGTSEDVRSNGFRVSASGAVYAKGEYNSSGADYAEFIKEWWDGNPDNEDRVGYFVTVKDGYLHKANEGDYIVGITSGNPSVVGNADEEYYWRWERDDFNRIIYEEVPELTEKFDENKMLAMVETGRTISVMKQSENYDSSKQQSYVERKNRPEWDAVGMIGVLPVRDDGTCIPGRYCKCADGGIATLAAERSFDTYMVIDRVTENIVSVILK